MTITREMAIRAAAAKLARIQMWDCTHQRRHAVEPERCAACGRIAEPIPDHSAGADRAAS